MSGPRGFRRMLAGARAMAARATRISRYALPRWRKPAAGLLLFTTLITVTVVGIGFYHIYLDRTNLPKLKPFARFDFATYVPARTALKISAC